MFLRAQFNYDTDSASNESGLECKDPSLAQQHEKEEADINTILRRFNVTGMLPQGVRMPSYEDFSQVTDYQSALNQVIAAKDAFMKMPAHVRSRFDNDPQKFLEFFADEANYDEAVKLGLLIPKPAVVPAVTAPAAPAGA